MKISGKSVYSLFLAKKLLNREIKGYKFKIQSEQFNETLVSSLILINNQPVFGGSFEVAPLTNHKDGTFNITILKHQNRLELIECIVKILRGDFPTNDSNLISFETNEVKIDLLDDEIMNFFGDGEILSTSNSWNIRCHADFLNVYSPKDQAELMNFCAEASL